MTRTRSAAGWLLACAGLGAAAASCEPSNCPYRDGRAPTNAYQPPSLELRLVRPGAPAVRVTDAR